MRLPAAAAVACVLGTLAWPTPAEADNDGQVWMAASGQYKVSKPFHVAVTGLLRLEDNASQVQNAAVELELQYRILNWWRVYGGYRFSNRRNNDDALEQRHRLYFDNRLIARLGPVRADHRLRIQESIRPGEDRHTLRNRVKVSYRGFDRLGPYTAVELFHRLGDGETIRLRTFRFTVGTNYELSKSQSAGLYYRLETPQDGQNDPNIHILGLNYSVGF